MGLILDSSVVIASERLNQTAYEMIEVLGSLSSDAEIAISALSVLELAHGIVRADTVERRSVRQRFLDDLLEGMPVYPVTVPIALRAGQIDGRLQVAGTRVSLADLLIGATAIELGDAVLTHNLRHFRLIPGLELKRL